MENTFKNSILACKIDSPNSIASKDTSLIAWSRLSDLSTTCECCVSRWVTDFFVDDGHYKLMLYKNDFPSTSISIAINMFMTFLT